MSKVRVYEVAKQLNMDQKALVALFQSLGLTDVKNHMSAVEQDVIERVKRHLDKSKAPALVEERIRPTVVKRRAAARPEPVMAAPEPVRSTKMLDVAIPAVAVAPVAPFRRPAAVERAAPRAATPEPVSPKSTDVVVAPIVPIASAPQVSEPEVETTSTKTRVVVSPVEAEKTPAQGDRSETPAAIVSPPSSNEDASAPSIAISKPAVAPLTAIAAVSVPESRPAAVVESPPPPVASAAATTAIAPPPASGRAVVPPSQRSASSAPKTGIDVWAGRPGVPMPPPPTPGPRRFEYNMGPARGPVANSTVRPGQRMGGGGARPGGAGGRPGQGGRGRPGTMVRRAPAAVSTKEMGADKKVIKIEEKVNLQTIASRMSLKATEVLMKLIQMGLPGVNINSTLDAETAKIVAGEFGWEVEDVAVSEEMQMTLARGPEEKNVIEGGEPRAPIVTVMGHVDHGKTSLLDQIRKANVAGGEAGGITQHIGAYRVNTPRGPIAFLDTPGHEAFTAMRARGASVTDIVVLVVAADDGVMPQTREAANHARAAHVPIIVAINKMDKPEADPERVKRQLMELSLVPEELGGDTIYCEVSAKSRAGIDQLLEMLVLQAELLELRANPKRPGHGMVIEALLDRGKGPVARVLVTDGTLHVGDFVLAGPAFGKIRAMTDDRGRSVLSAPPATPVEVLGLTDVPNAGDVVDAVKDAKKAQEIAEGRRAKVKSLLPATSKITLEDLALRATQQEQLELRLILKADVQGSVEAVADALVRLTGAKVRLSVILASVGAITEGDVNLAIASKAIIVGFNVRPAGKAGSLAETEGIEIRQYSIIYNVIDDIRGAMEGLLAPTLVERAIGKAEVRQVFKLSKSGGVAGCMIIDGVVRRGAKARLRREGEVMFDGKIAGLKRFKEDVKEVNDGFECGISLENFEIFKEGDLIEAFEIDEIRTKL